MTVPTSINDLSTTAGSNSPSGSESPGEGDNHLRAGYSFIAELRDKLNGTTTATIGTLLATLINVATLNVSGTATVTGPLSTAGNVALGNASGDTLNVGNGDIVKDASGNTGFGAASSGGRVEVTVADTVAALRLIANTGRIRVRPYISGTLGAGIESTNTAENAYLPLSLFGDSINLSTSIGAAVVVDSVGRLYGLALHNNAGGVTGTTNQYIASGTYTPAFTNVLNTTGYANILAQWMRVGNVVTVSFTVTVTTTTGGAPTSIDATLPIASTFTGAGQIAGAGGVGGSSIAGVIVKGNSGNTQANLIWTAPSSGSVVLTANFTYTVL